jgi:hypothetical protein
MQPTNQVKPLPLKGFSWLSLLPTNIRAPTNIHILAIRHVKFHASGEEYSRVHREKAHTIQERRPKTAAFGQKRTFSGHPPCVLAKTELKNTNPRPLLWFR